jgi:hypothetical protein
MRFEERELKPYAGPFPQEELKIGETYFAVLFLDDDGVVPLLETLVFIGRDREGRTVSRATVRGNVISLKAVSQRQNHPRIRPPEIENLRCKLDFPMVHPTDSSTLESG